MKQPLKLNAMFLLLASAAIAGCTLSGDNEQPTPERVYPGDTKEFQDKRIQTNIDISREMDGEKPDLACQCLLQAEEDINRYKRDPLDFGITREGIERIKKDNRCVP